MSGIAGLIRFDDEPLRPRDAATLAASLEHRGPDASYEWHDDSATLIYSELRTVPTVPGGMPPLEQGGIVLVADARLDHRDELIRQLELTGTPHPDTDDAVLLRHAFARWGRDCPRYLAGDFALVVFNETTREIFCARDHFGVKPLVYCHVPGRFFAFASEVRCLLELPDIRRTLDEQRIADFLLVHFDDHERTFYEALKRLPSGTSLSIGAGTRRGTPEPYWSLRDVAPLNLADSREYEERFRWHFQRAVRQRMRVRDPGELTCMMSGGLDSTSIACTVRDARRAAGEPPLHVVSWVFSDALEADERRFQELATSTGGFVRHALDTATTQYSPWTDLSLLLGDGPLYAGNFYLNYGAGQTARSLGARVLLDGLGGDSTISRGTALFSELLRSGRWSTLARELTKFARRDEVQRSWLRLLLTYALAPQAPPGLSSLVRRVRGEASQASLRLLHPRFAAHGNERQATIRRPRTCREAHLAEFEAPMIAEGLELCDRVLAMTQVEGRYPFFDRALVEFCVSLPAEQRLVNGYSRSILRRGLEGVLPADVQWRATKGSPGFHVIQALRARRERLDDLLVNDPGELAAYVNMDELRKCYREFMAGRAMPFGVVIQLWSAAVLSLWLRGVHRSPPRCGSAHGTA